jgi:hypothetical protein
MLLKEAIHINRSRCLAAEKICNCSQRVKVLKIYSLQATFARSQIYAPTWGSYFVPVPNLNLVIRLFSILFFKGIRISDNSDYIIRSQPARQVLNSILNEPLFPDYFDRNFSGPESTAL